MKKSLLTLVSILLVAAFALAIPVLFLVLSLARDTSGGGRKTPPRVSATASSNGPPICASSGSR